VHLQAAGAYERLAVTSSRSTRLLQAAEHLGWEATMRFSFTRLATYRRCPFQYKLRTSTIFRASHGPGRAWRWHSTRRWPASTRISR
jgi:hypothetical protein